MVASNSPKGLWQIIVSLFWSFVQWNSEITWKLCHNWKWVNFINKTYHSWHVYLWNYNTTVLFQSFDASWPNGGLPKRIMITFEQIAWHCPDTDRSSFNLSQISSLVLEMNEVVFLSSSLPLFCLFFFCWTDVYVVHHCREGMSVRHVQAKTRSTNGQVNQEISGQFGSAFWPAGDFNLSWTETITVRNKEYPVMILKRWIMEETPFWWQL